MWSIDDDRVQQIGGKGTDYAAWLKSSDRQHILVQIGQCGDAPEGDIPARRIVEAMIRGLNSDVNTK